MSSGCFSMQGYDNACGEQNEGKMKTRSEPLRILGELSATVLPNPHLEAVANGTLSDNPPPVDTRRSRLTLARAEDRLHIAVYGNVSPQTFAAFNTPTLSLPKTSLRATQAQPEVGERPKGGRCPRRGKPSGRIPRGEESPRSPRRLAGGRDSGRRCPTTVRGLSLVIGYPAIRETRIHCGGEILYES